jgi:hypothetical protein
MLALYRRIDRTFHAARPFEAAVDLAPAAYKGEASSAPDRARGGGLGDCVEE